MTQLIIFFIFVYLLFSSFLGALGSYISNEKGLNVKKGFLLGFSFNIFGLIWLALKKTSDEQLIIEMYNRNIIDHKEFEKTMEIALNKKHN